VPPSDTVDRVLVITAHPDDVDFGAAGTVATWTDQGIDVAYCVVTDGDAGGFDPSVPRSEIPAIRRAEQEAAAKVVGVEQVFFLGYPDGRLYPTLDLRRDLSRVIRRFRPERVLCPSAERLLDRIYASHPDHLAAGEAALCAVYPDARNPFAFPELMAEGLEAHTVPEVWVMAGPRQDVFVDITATIERKLTALLQHVSQHVDPESLRGRMYGWAESIGAAAGWEKGRLAEGFQLVPTG
jgi:LmbE family N-acetylglucosaminyl deacetylase